MLKKTSAYKFKFYSHLAPKTAAVVYEWLPNAIREWILNGFDDKAQLFANHSK